MATPPFSPLSPEFQRNPYAHYPALRAQPALFVKELNNWWVGRYRDVRAITSQPAVFSNAKFHEISLGEFNYAPEAVSLVGSDPPVHTRLRKLAAEGFKPTRLRALADRMRAIVDARLNALEARSDRTFDFQLDFAELIPVEVMSQFLGSDMARADDFRRWTGDILSASNRAAMKPEQLARIRRSVEEARAYFLDLIATRRKNPGDDVISAFIAAQDRGDELSDGEILSLCILLLNGGDETTAHLLGNALVALWNNPEQFELVKAEPKRIPDLVDETLRFDPPVQTVFLWTTCETEVSGTTIPAQSAVIGVWGSANRDEEEFPEPDKFDITREKRSHLSFGYGPHFCLGNMLAKQEAIITLERVLQRMPNIQLATAGPIDWIASYWIRGPRALPVKF